LRPVPVAFAPQNCIARHSLPGFPGADESWPIQASCRWLCYRASQGAFLRTVLSGLLATRRSRSMRSFFAKDRQASACWIPLSIRRDPIIAICSSDWNGAGLVTHSDFANATAVPLLSLHQMYNGLEKCDSVNRLLSRSERLVRLACAIFCSPESRGPLTRSDFCFRCQPFRGAHRPNASTFREAYMFAHFWVN
jgi:hypothetical protein